MDNINVAEIKNTEENKELISINTLPKTTKLNSKCVVDIGTDYVHKNIINVTSNIKSDDKYTLYNFKFIGQDDIPRYLFTDMKLDSGHNEVSLMAIDSNKMLESNRYEIPDELVVNRLCREQSITAKARIEAIANILKEKQDIVGYTEIGWKLLLDKNITRKLFYIMNKRLTKDVIYYFELGDIKWFKALIKKLFFERGTIDNQLYYLSVAHLVKFDTTIISPKKFMRFAPHMIWITNPGTGKTSIAKKIGICIDKCRVAGLLGYSDAKNIRIGSLNGRKVTTILDELQSEKDDSLFSAMNSYEEQGESLREMGMKNIKTIGYSPLIYISNPKPIINNSKKNKDSIVSYDENISTIELLNKFDDMLSKITDNTGAFGRRKGVVLFSEDIMKVDGKELLDEDLEIYQCIIESMFEYVAKNQTNFFLKPEIQDWLQKPISNSNLLLFKQQINNIPIAMVKDFWEGYIGKNGHIRGIAYRIAAIEYIFSFSSPEKMKNINIDEFLKCAEQHFEHILTISLKSLSLMTTTTTEFEKELILREYLAIDKEWVKYLMFAISVSEDSYNLNKLSMNILSKNYNDIFKFPDEEQSYAFFSRIESNMKKAKSLSNPNNVMRSFGVELLKESEHEYSIKINEPSKLEIFNEMLHKDEEFIKLTVNMLKSKKFNDIELLLRILEEIKDEIGVSNTEDLISELGKKGYKNREAIELCIAKLKEDGVLFSPQKGYLKKV